MFHMIFEKIYGVTYSWKVHFFCGYIDIEIEIVYFLKTSSHSSFLRFQGYRRVDSTSNSEVYARALVAIK